MTWLSYSALFRQKNVDFHAFLLSVRWVQSCTCWAMVSTRSKVCQASSISTVQHVHVPGLKVYVYAHVSKLIKQENAILLY